MRLRRVIISSLCMIPVLLGLYVLLASDYGELPDPPIPLMWVAFLWFGALVLWPFAVHGLLWQHEPHGIVWLVTFLVTALFWGFIIELFFMVKTRLRPNKSLQATRDGDSSSASRFMSFGPACLSSGRYAHYEHRAHSARPEE